jgi:uncharacterized Zn finger protein (UPF0148 family)
LFLHKTADPSASSCPVCSCPAIKNPKKKGEMVCIECGYKHKIKEEKSNLKNDTYNYIQNTIFDGR